MKASFSFYPFFLLAVSCSSQTSSQVPIVSTDQSVPVQNVAVESVGVNNVGSITLSENSLASTLRLRNPSLAAARKLIDEALGQLESSGLRSNPTVEIEFETTANFREPFLTTGISRSFPRTNRLLLEKRVSVPLVQAARAEVADRERLLIGEAREHLVAALAQKERIALLKQQATNARELAAFITEAAERGELSLLEPVTAEIEAQRLDTQATQAEIHLTLAKAKLAPLVGLADPAQLTLSGTLPPAQLPPLQVSVPQNRPDFIAARFRTQSAAEGIRLAEAEAIPDYEAGIFAGLGREVDEPEGGELEGVIGVRFSMPLGTDPQAPGKIRSAQAQRDRLILTERAMRKAILAEIRAAHAEMAQWNKLAQRIRDELIPKSQKNLGQIRTAYDSGQVPLQDVLRAREQELSLRLTRLEALTNFHQARARYLTATAN